MSAILFLQFTQCEKSYSVEEKATAGVSEMCELNLAQYFDDPLRTISRHHFQIKNTHEGFLIVDLRSLNGTVLNDGLLYPNMPQFLRDGDVIQVAQNQCFLIHVMLEDDRSRTRRLEETIRRQVQKLGIYFDENSGHFFVDGKPIPPTYFTELEHRLLSHLYQNAEHVCSYHNLAQHVWGGWAQDNTITQRISKLRHKLSQISGRDSELYIETGRGYVRGYMLKHGG